MLIKKCTVGVISLTLLAGAIYNIITADKKLTESNAVMVFMEEEYVETDVAR